MEGMKGDESDPCWVAEELRVDSGGGNRGGEEGMELGRECDNEGEPFTDDLLLFVSMCVLSTLAICKSLNPSAKLTIDTRLSLLGQHEGIG